MNLDFILHFSSALVLTACWLKIYRYQYVRISTLVFVTLLAFGKETYDYYDYGLFSWDDVLYTYIGGLFGVAAFYAIKDILSKK